MSDLLGAQLGQRRLNDLLVQAGLGPQPLTKVHNEVSGGRRKAELRRRGAERDGPRGQVSREHLLLGERGHW